MTTVPYLADINFWLALTFKKHPHSPSAWNWMDGQGPTTCFLCRMTQQGFLRLATNAKAISAPLTHHQAWQAYDKFLSDERIEFLEEPPDIETAWRRYSIGLQYSPKVWNDAYLAAFADRWRLKILTFDKGFTAYQDLSVELLS